MLEDAHKMTREDVYRELELLPVWRLRAPLPAAPIVESIQAVLTESIENKRENKSEEIEPIQTKPIQISPIQTNPIQPVIVSSAILIASNDKKWLFVLPAELAGQSAELFNNILRALKIKPTQTMFTEQLMQDIEQLGATVIVAMGEIAAQQVLSNEETFENLRGKLHKVNSAQVVVTYHPSALLLHLPHKAKTWDDLCLALSVVND